MLLDELVRTSAAVAGTSARTAKIAALAECLAALRTDEIPIAVAYLSGTLPHAPIGVGWAALRELQRPVAGPVSARAPRRSTRRCVGSARRRDQGRRRVRRSELEALFARATELPSRPS